MAPYVRRFIRASLVWLGIGVAIGLGMAFFPARHLVYKPAHAHANLLGFLSMFVFGVAYHVLPRFAGRPLAWESWAHRHVWIQNAGLALLLAGWLVRPTWWSVGQPLVWAGAALSAVGVGIFIAIAWRTVGEGPNAPLVR